MDFTLVALLLPLIPLAGRHILALGFALFPRRKVVVIIVVAQRRPDSAVSIADQAITWWGNNTHTHSVIGIVAALFSSVLCYDLPKHAIFHAAQRLKLRFSYQLFQRHFRFCDCNQLRLFRNYYSNLRETIGT